MKKKKSNDFKVSITNGFQNVTNLSEIELIKLVVNKKNLLNLYSETFFYDTLYNILENKNDITNVIKVNNENHLIVNFSLKNKTYFSAIVNKIIDFDFNSFMPDKNIFDNLEDAILVFDYEGFCRYSNRSFYKLTKTKVSNIKDKTIDKVFDLLNYDFKKFYNRIFKTLFNKKTFSTQLTLKNKIYKNVELSLSPILNKDNALIGVTVLLKDITEYIKTREKLKESEKKHRLLAQNIEDVVWTMDYNGNFTYVSPSIKKLLGFTPDEILNNNFSSVLTKSSLEKVKTLFKERHRLLKLGRPDFSTRVRLEQYRKDKSIVEIECITNTLYDDNKNPVGVIGVSRDISQQIKAERNLEYSEKKFSDMFYNHSAAMFLIDSERGKIVDANNAASEFYGYSLKDLKNKNICDINILGKKTFKKMKNALRKNKNIFEFKHKLKSGDIIDVEVHSSPIMIEGEKYLFSIIHDITSRKNAEKALRKSEEHYRVLFENSNDAIFLHDLKEDKFLDANEKACNMLGYTKNDLLNKKSFELSNLEETIRADIRKNIKNNSQFMFYDELIKKDGKIIPVEMNSIIFNKNNDNLIITIARDITRRKKLEQDKDKLIEDLQIANIELKKLSKLKNEIFEMASHDLKSPFSSILGFAQLLLKDKNLSEEKRMYIDMIEKSASVQLAYVDDLFSLAQIESGNIVLNKKNCNINEVIKKYIMTNILTAQKKNIEIEDIYSGDYIINIDETKIMQVINNLISNSIKYTNPGGKITVKLIKTKNNEVQIHVLDNGIGFNKKDIEVIFDKYFRIHKKGTLGESGTGIGLSICKHIIELHGGQIHVNSEKGKGSDFFFTLPAD